MDVGNYGTVCFRNSGIAAIYAVCGERAGSCKSGSFTEKNYGYFCVKDFCNRIFCTNTSVFYKERSTNFKVGCFKTIIDCRKNCIDVSFNCGRRKSVGNYNLYVRIIDAFCFDFCSGFIVEYTAKVRSGKIGFFAVAFGLISFKVVSFKIFFVNIIENCVHCSSVVCADTKSGSGKRTGACSPNAKTCVGFGLNSHILFFIVRIGNVEFLSEAICGDVVYLSVALAFASTFRSCFALGGLCDSFTDDFHKFGIVHYNCSLLSYLAKNMDASPARSPRRPSSSRMPIFIAH